MARKVVYECDLCGARSDELVAKLRLTYSDGRRQSREADLCEDCAGKVPGNKVARRGRPVAVAA